MWKQIESFRKGIYRSELQVEIRLIGQCVGNLFILQGIEDEMLNIFYSNFCAASK